MAISLGKSSIVPRPCPGRIGGIFRARGRTTGEEYRCASTGLSENQFGQPERQLRNVGHQEQSDDLQREHRQQRPGEQAQRHLRDARGDEQRAADWRRGNADAQVEGDDDAEVHRRDAQLHRHWQEDRREDQ